MLTSMTPLLQQLKKRRLALGLKQSDMMLRVGMSRQQYQRLESKGNPRLDTLELLAAGLGSELMLIPRDKLPAVIAALEGDAPGKLPDDSAREGGSKQLSDDPWKGLLGDD